MMLLMESAKFTDWLVEETTRRRGWSFRELGRRAGLSSGTISKVITGASSPGLEFCRGVARAFHISPEEVLRRAGLLAAQPEETALLREIRRLFTQLPPEHKEVIVTTLRALVEQQGREGRAS